jgi:uncharacterized protein DUF3560
MAAGDTTVGGRPWHCGQVPSSLSTMTVPGLAESSSAMSKSSAQSAFVQQMSWSQRTIGHHSEKRHRKDLNRIDQHFAAAKEHHDKAEYFRRRAAAAESNRAIFSDDPDATEKLVDKIERLKKRQGVMKRANQLIRKADREGLADLGFSDETIAKLLIEDFAGRVGFPNYALTNNSANIRRLEQRLAAIRNAQDDETTEEQFATGVRLVDNVEANRLQIFSRRFPRK